MIFYLWARRRLAEWTDWAVQIEEQLDNIERRLEHLEIAILERDL